MYVPRDEILQLEVIWLHHNILVAKHKEKWKIMELVTRNYWWTEVTKDVERYMEGCNLCQKIKNCMESLARKLMANEILEKLWIYLIVDFIIKSLLVVRKDVILVVCNRLSKMTHTFSNNKREELA